MFLKVADNNRAATVLTAFAEACEEYGIPEKTRSDKGKENVLAAKFMLTNRGPKSFITGRSVHNQRYLYALYTIIQV